MTISEELNESEDKPELKMWLAIRDDIKMSKGKLITQAGHAYGHLHILALRETPEVFEQYLLEATPKISVKAKNEAALFRIRDECMKAGIPYYLVRDAGRTEFNEPTYTVIAFGPAYRKDLPKFLTRLQLLKEE